MDRAKDVLNIAMKNIPFEHYGYYAFIEPFIDAYYKVGETDKARDLFSKLKGVYQDRLNYYAGMSIDEQYHRLENIISDIRAYGRIMDIFIKNADTSLIQREEELYQVYINKFDHFMAE